MDGTTHFSQTPVKDTAAAATAGAEASEILKKQGNLSLSIQTLLFCLLIFFAWITATQLLVIPFEYALMQLESVSAMLSLEVAYYSVCGILLFLFVIPVWLGRLRVAGLLCAEKMPMMREMFYFFTSAARYKRALLLSLVLAVQVLLPLLICAGVIFGAFELYFQVFYFEFTATVAALLLICCLLVALAFAVLVLFLTGMYAATAAIAVGNEELSLFAVFCLSLKTGKRNLPAFFRFAMRSLWHMLLSLVTFGVLFVLWYAHHYMISYLRLSMALCPKGEPEQ